MINHRFNLPALVRSRLGLFLLLALGLCLAAGQGRAAAAGPSLAAPPTPPAGAGKGLPPHLPALTPGCSLQWQLSGAASPGTGHTELHGVAAVDATNIWTAGFTTVGGVEQTLIEHWDGTAWAVVPSPNVPGTGNNALFGISAFSALNVWAVGATHAYENGSRPLAMHWDGGAWSVVPTNYNGAGDAFLNAVTIFSPGNVWAAGAAYSNGVLRTLIMTWTGNSLVVTSSPNLGAGANVLVGMMARTSTDVWAVGFGSGQAMALHQDGLGWSLIDTTSLAGNSALYAVQSMATDDAWAVGIRNGHTLTAHWNGSSWSVVPSPQPSMIRDELYGLSGTGTSDLWAVGSLSDTQSSDQTLALHWNGSTWAIVPSPSKGTSYNYLKAVVAFAADTATAVGDYVDSTTHDYQPLIEQYIENQQFSDVPGISPFYGYIHSLACRSILGGYTSSPPCPAGAAPCFLPGANVTRGQVAKILANAAALGDAIPSTQQTFEDVPTSNPFWLYIERLALPGRGYISGYACGQSPAGPCVAPGNRPYFLPGNPVTRGQLAKIDANAAGLNSPVPSSQQTFEDVPASNAFWIYVERLAPLNVISGYACGQAPAGACVAPGNRPYFLPGNPVTRGQTAKIVNNTFFP